MRRILLALFWIAVLLLVAQILYFVFFKAKAPGYHEGTPLAATPVSLPVHGITTLASDPSGGIWIGTERSGLYLFDEKTVRSEAYPCPEPLNEATVTRLLVDRQGRLWVGTKKRGLFINEKDRWEHYDIATPVRGLASSPVEGHVAVATDSTVLCYQPETAEWLSLEFPGKEHILPTGLAFDAKDRLFVATDCRGLFRFEKTEEGHYAKVSCFTAPRRFGPPSSPKVAPVPLEPCGQGLPSNQINSVAITHDGTIWLATAAGLAWSRDEGETWHFLRGRDYGDKVRGLLAGTPHGWKELPRSRFGELLPEDDISLLSVDAKGILWAATCTLGCVAMEPEVFYRNIMPEKDRPVSVHAFLEEMAKNTTRFYSTKSESVVSMGPETNGKMLVASRSGTVEWLECPAGEVTATPNAAILKSETATRFPPPIPGAGEPQAQKHPYPFAAFTGGENGPWMENERKFGKLYTLIGGGESPQDKLIAFDESACRVRLHAGFVGNGTRPLERVTLTPLPAKTDSGSNEKVALTAWRSMGNSLKRTTDGQHLWLEVKLNRPGRFRLTLFFADPEAAKGEKPRDYLIEIFSELKSTQTRIPKHDWQEFGRRADRAATENEPLALARANDFGDGVYETFELAGPGTYYVKVDKNYSRRIELTAVMIDSLDPETNIHVEIPAMTSDQSSDVIP